jgi:hypothetical protein
MTSFWRGAAHCLVFSLLAAAGFAQDASTGTIRGTVVDAAGSRVAGAIVVFVDAATGFRYSAITGVEGRLFELLPPGEYSGRAEARGMSPDHPTPASGRGWHHGP